MYSEGSPLDGKAYGCLEALVSGIEGMDGSDVFWVRWRSGGFGSSSMYAEVLGAAGLVKDGSDCGISREGWG